MSRLAATVAPKARLMTLAATAAEVPCRGSRSAYAALGRERVDAGFRDTA
jgi:hypothetical protein